MEPIETAKNRAHALLAQADEDLEAGRITEAEWYARIDAVVTPAYLDGANPRAQSGHSGDESRWRHARSLLVTGLHRDGSFLDVGCANGHLMECLPAWAAEESGISIEPHGLDISKPLADLARRRLPNWADRIHVGNAIDWTPPRRYDFVRTGLEYVPARRRRDLIERLLGHVVRPNGRLLIGVYNEERKLDALEEEIAGYGFRVAGTAHRAHPDERLAYKLLWLDA